MWQLFRVTKVRLVWSMIVQLQKEIVQTEREGKKEACWKTKLHPASLTLRVGMDSK